MLHVMVAVMQDKAGRVLIAKRPEGVHQGGLWEFPGGKRETNETRTQALRRELWEELDVRVAECRPLIQFSHHYPDRSVLLDVWRVDAWDGLVHGKEGQDIQWVGKDKLGEYDFPAANAPILQACRLPPHYLITPAIKGDEALFMRQLRKSLNNGVALIQYRQKDLLHAPFERLAAKVIGTCRQAGTSVLLNSSQHLVKRLRADGLHLSGKALMTLTERPLSHQYLVAASCHNADEVKHAAAIGVDFVTLSPVQPTATHPDAEPLGWDRFATIANQATLPVYALGGVSKTDAPRAWRCGGQGIAAIRALWPAAQAAEG